MIRCYEFLIFEPGAKKTPFPKALGTLKQYPESLDAEDGASQRPADEQQQHEDESGTRVELRRFGP